MIIRKYLSFFLLLLSLSNSQAVIIDEDGKIIPEVFRIVSHFGYIPTSDTSNEIEELNSFAQNNLLRPKKSERLDEKAIEHYKTLCLPLTVLEKQEILHSFEVLKDINDIEPAIINPNYIIIQGSTIPNMRDRVMFLAKLILENKINISPSTQIAF